MRNWGEHFVWDFLEGVFFLLGLFTFISFVDDTIVGYIPFEFQYVFWVTFVISVGSAFVFAGLRSFLDYIYERKTVKEYLNENG
jgi:hypothetical protein